jgi:hypothetical protein
VLLAGNTFAIGLKSIVSSGSLLRFSAFGLLARPKIHAFSTESALQERKRESVCGSPSDRCTRARERPVYLQNYQYQLLLEKMMRSF